MAAFGRLCTLFHDAHLVDPGLFLVDLYVPAEATHPPGAPDVHVQTVALPDGTRIARRSEVSVNREEAHRHPQPLRAAQLRGARRARGRDARAVTWYDEDEIAALLREAGFRDIAVGPPAQPVGPDTPAAERRFSGERRDLG